MVGRPSTSRLTYAAWTERLCHHFFHEDRAELPVTYFVDDDLLGFLEGSGDPEKGVQSLVAAVQSRLSPDTHGRRFDRIDSQCTTWKVEGADGCPPSLPLLGVAVLAGTRMARERGISMTNYWKRFRDLLELGERNDLKGINDVLPGLWEQLSWWLDKHHNGRLGRSTVEADPWWTIIGYALSQALFRQSDRQHLTDLFRRIGLAPDEQPNPGELLQYFKAWAPGSLLSTGAKHMASDGRYDVRLTAILVDEASRWDGVLRDEQGRKLGALVLAYEPFPRPRYTLAAERPLGFPEDASFRADGETQRLTALVEGWYGERWPLDPMWLQDGLRLESGQFVLLLRPAPVVPFARNPVLGCWASVSRVEPGESHVVLADHAHTQIVEMFLRENARDDWTKESDQFAPQGWVLFTGVVLEESLDEIPAGPLAVLAPRLRERPTLKGGLLLESGVKLYLCGGEPDLWLPSLLDSETIVSVDGRALEATAGQRIPLAAQRLSAGSHEVTVGAAKLRFATTRELRDEKPLGAGALGHESTKRDGRYLPESVGATLLGTDRARCEVAVSGAHLLGAETDLPVSRPTIVLRLGARRYRLVGAKPGQVEEPREPARPDWMDSAGNGTLYPIGFEVSPSFDVVWVVVEREGRTMVRLRHPLPPYARDGKGSLELNDWCSVFDFDPELDEEARELWREYRAVAAALPRLSAEDAALERKKHEAPSPQAQKGPLQGQPRTELVLEDLIRLPLKHRSAHQSVYESSDKRFQVTYSKSDRKWTVTERVREKGEEKRRLGRFQTEDEALDAVKEAIHTIHTIRRGGVR